MFIWNAAERSGYVRGVLPLVKECLLSNTVVYVVYDMFAHLSQVLLGGIL